MDSLFFVLAVLAALLLLDLLALWKGADSTDGAESAEWQRRRE